MSEVKAKMAISYQQLGEVVAAYARELDRLGYWPAVIVEQSNDTGQLLWCARLYDFWLCSHPHEQPVRDFVEALEKELCN